MSLTLSPTSVVRLDRPSDARLTTGLRSAVMLALTVLAVNFFAPTSRGQDIAASQDAEVLTRGPVHDAFAMPVGLDPVPGVVVPNQPPADIEELPPEVAVEDPNAEWIAGYWNWDEERNDFIWISGVWRVAPPDHRWVAGYWTEVQGGFQRISGFWAPIEVRQVVYYPQPPQSLEAGPNSPQPSPNYFWVPGNWVYTDGRYLWRGGYWAVSQENWVWMPAYYVRTPGGYIYNAGYWDYPLDNRGMMFAPVYINRTVYMRPNYYYSPSVVIRAASLLVHLFARPTYGSYYFGDYYGPTYATAGYQPWFNAGGGPRGGVRWYDPIYTYQRSRHRGDPNWNRHLHERYDFYASNQDARPRRTFEEQRRFASVQGPNRDRDEFRNAILATSVADVINNVSNTTINNTTVNKETIKNITNVNIRRVQNDERKTIQKQALEVKQFAKQRSEVERQGRVVAAGNVGGPNNRGPNADPNRGPRPGAEPAPGANVAAGVQAPALTLPDLPVGERGNRGRGPGNTAGPNNTTRPGNAGPGNVAGPSERPNREGRPERPDANRPQRPDNVAGPTPNLPNGVNPDADRPQTGRPADMPPGRRTGSAIPGSDTPVNPAVPSPTQPNVRPRPTGVNPMPSGTPGIPRLPGIGEQPRDPRGPNPRNPERPGNPGLPGNPNRPGGVDPSQPVPLPRPTLPNPTATSPKLRIPDQPRSVEQPRNRELPGNPNRPNIGDQPRNVPPRTELPRGVPGLGEQPRPGNGPGRGNRPDGGRPEGGRPEGIPPRVNLPGAGGPNVNRENPMPRPEARPQQRERPQGGPEAKPDRGPKVKASDAPQTPPGAKPDGTKPEKKKKD